MTIQTLVRLENPVVGIHVRQSTPEEIELIPGYDHTALSNVNMCPTWGIVRYVHHRRLRGPHGRALALEAGSAMHNVFAAVRLCELYEAGFPEHFYHHGQRIFADKWEELKGIHHHYSINGSNEQRLAFCLHALEVSGYYDDPSDKRRTVSNLQECAIEYVMRWRWGHEPVFIADKNNPQAPVGIETPFSVTITFTFANGKKIMRRYTGVIDGLQVSLSTGKPILHENKTASRLSDAWEMSFSMAHQPTGYMIAGSSIYNVPIFDARIIGISIPLTRSTPDMGLRNFIVQRDSGMLNNWFSWFWHSANIIDLFKNDPIGAPKYTHSCNRYFRPCSMLPFCAAPLDEQQVMWGHDDSLGDFEIDKWDPLHIRDSDD